MFIALGSHAAGSVRCMFMSEVRINMLHASAILNGSCPPSPIKNWRVATFPRLEYQSTFLLRTTRLYTNALTCDLASPLAIALLSG